MARSIGEDADVISDDWSARLEELDRRVKRWFASLPRPVAVVGSSVAICVAYMAVAQWSYAFVIPPAQSAVFWVPSGITFALFVRARRASWLWSAWLLAVFVGEVLVVWANDAPLGVASAWGLANVFLLLTGVVLARRFAPEPFGFRRLRDVFALAAITVVAAVPGALVASAAAVTGLGEPSFTRMALSWWCSDALGILLVAPVILSWTTRQPRPAGSGLEVTALFLGLFGFAAAVVLRGDASGFARTLPSVMLLFLAWAAIRFGPRATTLAIVIVDSIVVVSTTRGSDLYGRVSLSPAERLLDVQLLIASVSLLVLLLAASIEEQRAARRAAENATRIRDEFLNIASHELHTPLTSLQLSVQMLADGSEQPRETRVRFLDVIERQVQRLTALISDLLDTTRIREGRISLTLEQVDLAAVVRDVAARAAGLLARSGSTLTIHADTPVPVSGRWDRTRIEQIATNLLSNAVKFGAGQPIDVTVDRETDEVARLIVADRGIGIPPDRLPHIFGRFEQAVAEHHYGGLGLGLYIVRSLVERLGGSIAVESLEGSGSTFTVRLPLRGPSA